MVVVVLHENCEKLGRSGGCGGKRPVVRVCVYIYMGVCGGEGVKRRMRMRRGRGALKSLDFEGPKVEGDYRHFSSSY